MPDLEFDPYTPLYTSDANAWRLDQLDHVLNLLVTEEKPLIVFVHGRGNEPKKSLRGATFAEGLAVSKLQTGYSASVLMFNWDSAFPFVAFWNRKRPLANARPAAKPFSQFLIALGDYRRTHPEFPAPVLLVHSMGSWVIKAAVEEALWPSGQRLFERIVLSQPDVDDVGHRMWLDELASRESVFVTLNQHDKVLLRSRQARPDGCHALGLDTKESLATQASYVDLTNMGPVGSAMDDDHEVFGKGAMNGQVYVRQFFEQALTGRPVILDMARNVESVTRDVVYRLKKKFEGGEVQDAQAGDIDLVEA